jgi:hypothetical protein
MEISRVEAIHCSKGHANVLERASEVRHKRASGGRRRRRKMWKLGTGSWAQTGTAAGKRRNGNAERHFQFGQRFMWPRACEGALRLFSRDMHCRRGAVSTAPDQATSVQNGRTPQLAATEREKHTTRAYSNDSPHMTAAVRLQTLPSGPRHPLL